MSLLDVLRAGIKTADKILKPLQGTVTYSQNIGDPSGYNPKYGPEIPMLAIVDWKQTLSHTPTGVITVTRPYVIFLDIAAVVAATGGVGIKNNDRVVLPDGTTGPLNNLGGFLDAGTGRSIYTEGYVG